MDNTIEELEAWQNLYGEEFNFGPDCIGKAEFSFADDYIYEQEIDELMYRKNPRKKRAAGPRKSNRITDQERMDRQFKRYNESTSPFIWYYEDIGLYRKHYLSGCRKMCKLQTNRKIRNSTEKIPNGCFFHKMFDYWWTLF